MITVSLQEKNGVYQAVLNYRDENNKRKQKWRSTGLTVRGNKKLATQKAEQIKADFEKELSSNGDMNEIADMLFADFMFYWLKIKRNTLEETTYASYLKVISNISEYFYPKKIKLGHIELCIFNSFITQCMSGD